ncbi:hypothetical protein MASSI9I_20492 [Massilia sp. 9I]|nr:hypothetical protein MASSI9I_20492 [Massilia sp. 9I]
MFAERYLVTLNTSDLRDDEQHQQTETLAAAALADQGGGRSVFGSLLARAKYVRLQANNSRGELDAVQGVGA